MAAAMAYDGKSRKIQSRRSATCWSSRSGILRMVTVMMVAMPEEGRKGQEKGEALIVRQPEVNTLAYVQWLFPCPKMHNKNSSGM